VVLHGLNNRWVGRINLRNLNKHVYAEKLRLSSGDSVTSGGGDATENVTSFSESVKHLSITTTFFSISEEKTQSAIVNLNVISIMDLQRKRDPKNRLYSTYCKVTVETNESLKSRIILREFETKRIFSTKDPFYNEMFKFYVHDYNQFVVRIAVHDEKTEEEIGHVMIPLNGCESENRYKLSGVEMGDIELKFWFTYISCGLLEGLEGLEGGLVEGELIEGEELIEEGELVKEGESEGESELIEDESEENTPSLKKQSLHSLQEKLERAQKLGLILSSKVKDLGPKEIGIYDLVGPSKSFVNYERAFKFEFKKIFDKGHFYFIFETRSDNFRMESFSTEASCNKTVIVPVEENEGEIKVRLYRISLQGDILVSEEIIELDEGKERECVSRGSGNWKESDGKERERERERENNKEREEDKDKVKNKEKDNTNSHPLRNQPSEIIVVFGRVRVEFSVESRAFKKFTGTEDKDLFKMVQFRLFNFTVPGEYTLDIPYESITLYQKLPSQVIRIPIRNGTLKFTLKKNNKPIKELEIGLGGEEVKNGKLEGKGEKEGKEVKNGKGEKEGKLEVKGKGKRKFEGKGGTKETPREAPGETKTTPGETKTTPGETKTTPGTATAVSTKETAILPSVTGAIKQMNLKIDNSLSCLLETKIQACGFKTKEFMNEGILEVYLIKANEVISNKIVDPYIKVYLNGEKIYKTKKVPNCKDPIFNERVKLKIKRTTDVLTFDIYDYNAITASYALYHHDFPLMNLEPGYSRHDIKMYDVVTGKLTDTTIEAIFNFTDKVEKNYFSGD